jgi:hypothetical protein
MLQLSDIYQYWWIRHPELGTIPEANIVPMLLVLDPLPVQGRGRPRGALGGATRGTRREPSTFEIPSSSAPPALNRPQEPPQGPIFIVNSGLRRLDQGHQDLYDPGTQHQRAYMRGIGTVYQADDASTDASTAAEIAIEGGIIQEIEMGEV